MKKLMPQNTEAIYQVRDGLFINPKLKLMI